MTHGRIHDLHTGDMKGYLAARKAGHADTIKTAIKVQAGVQAVKAIAKCALETENECT